MRSNPNINQNTNEFIRICKNIRIFNKLIFNNIFYLKYSALEGLLQNATLFDELTAATPSWETRSVVDQPKPGKNNATNYSLT